MSADIVARSAAVLEAAALLLVSGCAPADQARAPLRVEIGMTEYAYSEPVVDVPAGRPVILAASNHGQVDHDLVIDDLKVRILARPAAAGQAVLGALAPGEHVIYCSIPTHRELGMSAVLRVR